jgi:hypothetical protein
MKYRVLKKGDKHAIQIKRWYGWATFFVGANSTTGPAWLLGNAWYGMTEDELVEWMKDVRKAHLQTVQVVKEGQL